MRVLSRNTIPVVLALLAVPAWSGLSAQADSSLDPITVTATRRAQRAFDPSGNTPAAGYSCALPAASRRCRC